MQRAMSRLIFTNPFLWRLATPDSMSTGLAPSSLCLHMRTKSSVSEPRFEHVYVSYLLFRFL